MSRAFHTSVDGSLFAVVDIATGSSSVMPRDCGWRHAGNVAV